jgi:phage-related baseplate assembly protein
MRDGNAPPQETIQRVLDACNAKEIRPQTDLVSVTAAEPVEYDITLTYYTTAAEQTAAYNQIEAPDGAIDQYKAWQDTRIGRGIEPDELERRIFATDWAKTQDGIRVDIAAPERTELGQTQYAKFSGKLSVSRVVRG